MRPSFKKKRLNTLTADSWLCPICCHPLLYYLRGTDLLYETSTQSFDVYRCSFCGLEKILPPPTRSEISSFYPANYYSYGLRSAPKSFLRKLKEKLINGSYDKKTVRDWYYWLSLFFRRIFFHEFFEGIPLKRFGNHNFLDVGCGDGYVLSLLSNSGWETAGFEIGGQTKINNIYYAPNLEEVNFAGRDFACIRVWSVLEHVPDADSFLITLKRLLSSRGVIVCALPNTSSLYARLFGRYWFNRDIPRHLTNYNPLNLTLLLDKHGLKIKTISYQSQGGGVGSLEYWLKAKCKLNVSLNNIFMFLLLYPLDLICNFLKIGDYIVFIIERK